MMKNNIICITILLCLSCSTDKLVEEKQAPIPIIDNIEIGCFYYPWFGENRHWEDYIGKPLLGEYNSHNIEVVDQHIDWAIGHGIDFFLMSWWGRNSYEDDALKSYFAASELAADFKMGILYEAPHLLGTTTDGSIDFDNPTVLQSLKEDFEYMASTYFSHDRYLKVNSKPVVYFYLTRIFTGDYANQLTELRTYISGLGFEMYLIGDQVYWQSPDSDSERQLMQQFDAISSYNMHTAVPDIATDFVDKVSVSYEQWFEETKANNVAFIPNVMPGFNDTAVRQGNPIIPRSEADFQRFCQMSLNYLSTENMVLITSWNEWHEYTSVEPDQTFQTKYLEIIKEELAGQR